MARYANIVALRSKLETVYGTDPTPTGADNAIKAIDVVWTPMEGQEVSRDFLTPYLGHPGVVLTGLYTKIEFSVEMSGSGTPGTPPAWGPLHRSCGMTQEITADIDVKYLPTSEPPESIAHYYNEDGVNKIILGSVGTWTTELVPQGIPRWRYTYIGLDGVLADQAVPVVDLTDFVDAVPVSKANTTFSLHGYAGPTERISFDYGNDLQARMLINHESMRRVDRRASGSAVIEAPLLATKNWDAIARAHTRAAYAMQHGVTAGNIVKIGGPKSQIGRWGRGVSQKIINNTVPFMITPNAGDDELVVTVQ